MGDRISVRGIAKDLSVSEGTAYRAIKDAENIGLVSRLSMENLPARYELVIHEKLRHHHLICLQCDQLQEIEERLTDDLKMQILKEKQFQVADQPMKIYGYCSKCQ